MGGCSSWLLGSSDRILVVFDSAFALHYDICLQLNMYNF